MPIASCPACHESVMVPADAQADSIVRCPMCQEQFQLEEFLAQLPPSLIIVSGPERSTIQGDSAAPWTGPQATETDAPAFEFTPGSAPVGDVPRARIRAVEASERPRQKSVFLEITKVVAGGLIALPLAQLILWWLPGRWQRDPLQLGPKVGHVIPWIVPSSFRAAAIDPSDENADVSSGSSHVPTAGDEVRESKSRRSTIKASNANGTERTEQPSMPAAVGGRQPPAESTKSAGSEPTGADSVPEQTAPEQNKGSVPDEMPGVTGKKPDRSSSKSQGNDPASPVSRKKSRAKPVPASSGVLGVTNAPLRKASELKQALETAQQISDMWGRSEPGEQKLISQQDAQMYDAFARLGEAITFVDRNEKSVRRSVELVQGLLMSLSLQPKKLVAIGSQAAAWLDRPDRNHQGVLLFGTVKSVQLQGPYYQTELELASRQRRVVPVMSRTNPSGVYGPKDLILILGAIVDDPATHLAAYEGKQEMVVMGGFPVPLGR